MIAYPLPPLGLVTDAISTLRVALGIPMAHVLVTGPEVRISAPVSHNNTIKLLIRQAVGRENYFSAILPALNHARILKYTRQNLLGFLGNPKLNDIFLENLQETPPYWEALQNTGNTALDWQQPRTPVVPGSHPVRFKQPVYLSEDLLSQTDGFSPGMAPMMNTKTFRKQLKVYRDGRTNTWQAAVLSGEKSFHRAIPAPQKMGDPLMALAIAEDYMRNHKLFPASYKDIKTLYYTVDFSVIQKPNNPLILVSMILSDGTRISSYGKNIDAGWHFCHENFDVRFFGKYRPLSDAAPRPWG